ncbi:MAG: DUF3416 domain-containing protein, partial [Acidimicrobiia bacterium]|nr:DUF3416 domain-containing protein [Acidimicrobiia bacterium]
MTGRIVVDDLRPRTPGSAHPAKSVVGTAVRVSADIFRDGHAILAARARWRTETEGKWRHAPMVDLGNDRWEAVIEPTALGLHTFVVEAWTDLFATWSRDVTLKHDAGQDIALELEEGAHILSERAAEVDAAGRKLLKAAATALRDA